MYFINTCKVGVCFSRGVCPGLSAKTIQGNERTGMTLEEQLLVLFKFRNVQQFIVRNV